MRLHSADNKPERGGETPPLFFCFYEPQSKHTMNKLLEATASLRRTITNAKREIETWREVLRNAPEELRSDPAWVTHIEGEMKSVSKKITEAETEIDKATAFANGVAAQRRGESTSARILIKEAQIGATEMAWGASNDELKSPGYSYSVALALRSRSGPDDPLKMAVYSGVASEAVHREIQGRAFLHDVECEGTRPKQQDQVPRIKEEPSEKEVYRYFFWLAHSRFFYNLSEVGPEGEEIQELKPELGLEDVETLTSNHRTLAQQNWHLVWEQNVEDWGGFAFQWQ